MVLDSSPLKRNRETNNDELEINLSLPEPLSKRDSRKSKKAKLSASKKSPELDTTKSHTGSNTEKENPTEPPATTSRSQWGIWVGNMPWTVTKQDLREFLCKNSGVEDKDITRVHMPAPTNSKDAKTMHPKLQPKNKGFAYVDFSSADALQAATKLSETLLLGRRVLIKNAKSFEGRPETTAEKEANGAARKNEKPPSKRIFVGNLAFDVTKEDLEMHFKKCGEITDVHVATFEDSGKCKGFAWITFAEIYAATTAVRGWLKKGGPDEVEDEDGGTDSRKPLKSKRIYVNNINGRKIRCEFAEDPSVRYRKRFGKGSKNDGGDQEESGAVAKPQFASTDQSSSAHDRRRMSRKENREAQREYRPPTTTNRPAQVTGAIVKGSGNKVTFD
jgi:RNA recognition motif-containing protein